MATRTHARQAVIELLYAREMGNSDIVKFVDEILREKKIRNAQADFARNLFFGALKNIANIDEIIAATLKAWDLARLGAIDKCILQLGAYELLYTQTDAPVVINEALEIAKILGAENTGRFINGVLDAINKRRKSSESNSRKSRESAQDSDDSKRESCESEFESKRESARESRESRESGESS